MEPPVCNAGTMLPESEFLLSFLFSHNCKYSSLSQTRHKSAKMLAGIQGGTGFPSFSPSRIEVRLSPSSLAALSSNIKRIVCSCSGSHWYRFYQLIKNNQLTNASTNIRKKINLILLTFNSLNHTSFIRWEASLNLLTASMKYRCMQGMISWWASEGSKLKQSTKVRNKF